jgi:Family of unknown function (DUF6338)
VAPPVTVTALLVVLALVPGWVYLRLVERLRPRSTGTPLNQLLEVVAVGGITTGLSAFLVAVLPHPWLPFLLDVGAWAERGPDYLRVHWRSAAGSVALIFGLATMIAVGLYLARARSKEPEFVSHDNWVQSLGVRPPDKAVWVGLELEEDGSLVEGQLYSYSLDDDPTKRNITLTKPIRFRQGRAGQIHEMPNLDRLIVPAGKITFISVIHVPGQAKKPKRP